MSQSEYLQEQILNRLRMDNPWWATNTIDDYFQQMQRRLYLELFYPLVADTDLRRGLLLMGPRRVGKTVMLYHTIQKLIDGGIDPQKIIFISIETPYRDWETDRKSTRLNSSHITRSRMPSSA